MEKKLVGMERSGSWAVFIILLIVFFPLGILYWLLKMKKKKVYKYK